MIALLIQGFKQHVVESQNISQEMKEEIVHSIGGAQEMNVETFDIKGLSQEEKPEIVQNKEVSQDMKQKSVQSKNISQQEMKEKTIQNEDISQEMKTVQNTKFSEEKKKVVHSIDATHDEKSERVDSREIFDKESTEKVPKIMLDVAQSGQTDITEQPEQKNQMSSQAEVIALFKCDNVGRFAYPGNCEKYYFCFNKNEDHRVFNCPHHQAFDPITQACVHNFAVCAAAPECKLDKRILPNVNDKTTYFECKFRHLSKKRVLRKRSCDEGREFDAKLGYCKSKFLDNDFPSDSSNSSEAMECEQPGIFTDYSNDFDYYECVVKSVSKGTLKLIRHSCPAYHIFIKSEKQCVPFITMK